MNTKKLLIATSLLGFVSTAIIACTNNSQGSNTTSNNTGNTSPGASQGNAEKKLQSVAFTAGDLSNPFFVLMGQQIEATAKKNWRRWC